jgi:hypothetical protein
MSPRALARGFLSLFEEQKPDAHASRLMQSSGPPSPDGGYEEQLRTGSRLRQPVSSPRHGPRSPQRHDGTTKYRTRRVQQRSPSLCLGAFVLTTHSESTRRLASAARGPSCLRPDQPAAVRPGFLLDRDKNPDEHAFRLIGDRTTVSRRWLRRANQNWQPSAEERNHLPSAAQNDISVQVRTAWSFRLESRPAVPGCKRLSID